MPEIATFQFPATGQALRTVSIDGEPQFVAADIAALLEMGNVYSSLALLDDDEKGLHTVETPGGPQQMATVTEAGLYSLILRSRKAEAKTFKRWVTHEVLPAIRRTGRYELETLGDPLAEIEAATRNTMKAVALAKQERAAKESALALVAELAPDAARARQTLDTSGLSLVRTVAKRFGIQEKAFRAFLHAEHLLIATGTSRNEPYAAHVQAGHFEVKVSLVEMDPDRPAVSRSTTYVTPKGEALIWKRLFDAGYVTSRTMPPAPSEQLALVAA